MAKKIVGALFDDGEQSVKNTLDPDKYKVYSFGIQEKSTVEKLDMTNQGMAIRNKLDKYPQPDYIVASPPCIVGSTASGIEKGMNAYLHYDTLEPRNKESFKDSMYKFENSPIKGINKKEFYYMSVEMLINTLYIINFYAPKHGYIENPRLSKMGDYIKSLSHDEKGYFNIAMYGAYNHPVKKPTIFYSDLKMELKQDTKGIKFLKGDKDFTDRTKRSSIPKELIEDIFNKFEERYVK